MRSAGVSSHRWQVALVVVIALYAVAALFQSLMLPVFEGPDEQKHYAYVRYLVNNRSLPPIAKSQDDNSTGYGVSQMAGNPPLYYGLVAMATAPVPNADDVAEYLDTNSFFTAYDVYGVHNDNHNVFLHGPEDERPFRGAALALHLGRLVSVVLGVFTLLGVYGIARAVDPHHPGLGVLAVGLVACLPQFVFLHSAITPDVGVILFATFSMWTAVKLLRDGPALSLSILGGLFCGLTLLSKINGVWVCVIVWAALILSWFMHRRFGDERQASVRSLLAPLLLSVAVCGLVAGWWFVRGVIAGDGLGIRIHALGNQSPLTISNDVLANLPWYLSNLEPSFWYGAGWAALVPGPPWLYSIYRVVYLIGLASFAGCATCVLIQMAPKRRGLLLEQRITIAQCALLTLCALFAVAGAIYWILIYRWTLGRLAFPGLASAAVLAALGWRALFELSRRISLRLIQVDLSLIPIGMVVLLLLIGTVGGIVTTNAALHRHPEIEPFGEQFTSTQLTFLDPLDKRTPVATVVGYHIPFQYLYPGQVTWPKICWQSHGYTRANYPYSVQLVGPNGVRPATRNSFHGLGTYPIKAWQPDEVFCDPTALLIIDNVDRVRAYNLVVTLFERKDDAASNKSTKPLPAIDANGKEVYPVIGRVRVAPVGPMPNLTPTVRFGDFAGFVDADADVQLGGILSVTMRWKALDSTPVNATVFFHALDKASGKLVAQDDHPPDGGWFPTNYWLKGDVIEDQFQLKLPTDKRLDQLHFAVGLYEAGTGKRQTAIDMKTGEHLRDDAAPVSLRIRWQR